MDKRASGVILHITSLPGRFGIGDLGREAFNFADFLEKTGQTYWQILPLNPTDRAFGNSPYSSYSSYAGNTILISPRTLFEEGLLGKKDIEIKNHFLQNYCDYGKVIIFKRHLLETAYCNFKKRHEERKPFEKFCSRNSFWLDDYALFVALKQGFGGKPWSSWPDGFRDRRPKALEKARKSFYEEIEMVKFFQFLFFKQWFMLKKHCNKKGIRFIGDIPIYVNHDSADVWARPDIFKLDKNKMPVVVAGVPPDYFSETGQRWGNPVYCWDTLQKENFEWWIRRFDYNFKLFDKVRIDHFRGFVGFWEIPAAEETAVNGEWIKAPADEFFSEVIKKFPKSRIIAEDLGIITDDVKNIMEKFGFAGMKVLLFAFSGDLVSHPYLPHNYTKNCVVYTGTHDNNTVKGWFENDATHEEKLNIAEYTNRRINSKNVSGEFINLAMTSPALTAIFPMQDILGLDQASRMNFPSRLEGNWQWRLSAKQLTPSILKKLLSFTVKSKRD